jgi:hypothetical protein
MLGLIALFSSYDQLTIAVLPPHPPAMGHPFHRCIGGDNVHRC